MPYRRNIISSKDLIAAPAKAVILSLLLSGESYGYQIIKRVRRVSGGTLEWSHTMLYPVLHQMEREGLIRSEWKTSPENRMRKYYTLTERGRAELAEEKARWRDVQAALRKILGPISTAD